MCDMKHKKQGTPPPLGDPYFFALLIFHCCFVFVLVVVIVIAIVIIIIIIVIIIIIIIMLRIEER